MASSPPVVLSIAGFDPSAGAGITADIKTIAAHGCYGVACITAVTVQSTRGVKRVEPVSVSLIRETLEELAADLDIRAVKIGMLGSGRVAGSVAEFLAAARLSNVVLDPIVKSSSGAELIDRDGLKVLTTKILPLAMAITPNIEEAARLTGKPVSDREQMRQAASQLKEMGCPNVVVTGGHLEKAMDVLGFTAPNGAFEFEVFQSERHPSRSTHGTGCAFSTALACHLALGRGVPEGVLLAKAYVSAAIANAQPLGTGTGPVHHLYRMDQPRRVAAVVEPEHKQ